MGCSKSGRVTLVGAVNFQKLMLEKDGIPYRSPSNTGCAVVENLYMGESATGLRFADDTINEKLNKNGIASAAFIGGQWVVWGAHTGDYAQDDAGNISASETNMMMMYYLSNDFQHRRAAEIDTPMTMNRLKQIVAEEQARLDALISTGALLYGKCLLNRSRASGLRYRFAVSSALGSFHSPYQIGFKAFVRPVYKRGQALAKRRRRTRFHPSTAPPPISSSPRFPSQSGCRCTQTYPNAR